MTRVLSIAGAAMLAAALLAGCRGPAAQSESDAPEQPILFMHNVHAGENQIPCMYCHYTADRSVDAGIPPVEVCAGCHAPGGAPMVAADRPEVKKLLTYWEQKRPIPWVRIYDVPDFVHFPHMMHVNAGLQCQQCHGAVETMAEVERVESLQMGWCINCHQERQARIDCFVCHY